MSKFVLPVMEHFHTIQGEGHHQGRAAYFIRLGGCDVGCVWCDVKESWDASKHPQFTVSEIVKWVTDSMPNGLVVITGGEPLMHPLDLLTSTLQAAGYRTHLETSGTHPLSGQWDWICFSPKKFREPLPEIYNHAHELKVVINHPSDLGWAETHRSMVGQDCLLYLQPEWEKQEKYLPGIIAHVKENPQWRIGLQTHKYLQVP
jgi:7-carboxy-7-deazaguanine synthase